MTAHSMIERSVEPDEAIPMLSVEGLTIDLQGATTQRGLVQDLTFDLAEGRSLALIGESGCGKTLTAMAVLQLLPRQLEISSGSIRFDGQDLVEASERELRRVRGGPVGMVFQEPMSSLNPTMTIGDQIGESRRIHLGESRKVARQAARGLLERVGIPNADRRIKSYPHELSGGMQQRAMIAAAIACKPKLLIADEPTTALDVTIQAEILDLLRELQEELRLAVLLVTHDLGVVADFCDDVVVMYAGHAAERSTVDQVILSPRHPYTRALTASTPHAASPRTFLNAIPGRVPAAGTFPEGCRFQPRCAHAIEAECSRPQPEVLMADGHRTRCGRVARGELELEAVL